MIEPAPGRLTTESTPAYGHRQILASAALLGTTTVLVKLVAFGKDWLVARQFGAGDELDAFLVAFLLPSYAVSVLAHSVASALTPTYLRLCLEQGRTRGQQLVGGVLVGGSVGLIVVALTIVFVGPLLVPELARGFPPAKLALTQSLLCLLAGVLVASGISAIFAAVLNAEEHFRATAWAPLAVPLGTILIFWPLRVPYGIDALAAGTLLGFVAECAVLGWAMWHHGLAPRLDFTATQESLRHVLDQYWPFAVGSLLMSSSLVIDQAMAASLGSGNVSVLNYGNKIVALVLSMVAVSLSTVLFPRFSRLIAAGQWNVLTRMLRVYARLIFIGAIPVVVLLALGARPMIALLFQRGAFSEQTTAAASQVQIYLALQIPFYILVMVGYRVLSALDGNRIVLRLGALNLAMNVAGNYVLMRFFGVNGIALSTSLMYVVAAIATFLAIRYRLADARQSAGE